MEVLVGTLAQLDAQVGELDAEIARRAMENDIARRLMTAPGIGPLIATAIAVLAPPPEAFRRGRDFSAWLGLVPRQHLTGGSSEVLFPRNLAQGEGMHPHLQQAKDPVQDHTIHSIRYLR